MMDSFTIGFFGPSHMKKADEQQIATPVGEPCLLCEEAVAEGDAGTINRAGQVIHYECGMRSITGSVGHQMRLCSCYGGDQEDPPGMSRREAAKAALAVWEASRSMTLAADAVLASAPPADISPSYAYLERCSKSGVSEVEHAAHTLMAYYEGAEFPEPSSSVPAIPNGYKIVPVKATPEMLAYAAECTKQIGSDARRRMEDTYYFLVYAAPDVALQAAPTEQAGELPPLDLSTENWSGVFHTAFRHAGDSRHAMAAHTAIESMRDNEWGNIVDYMLHGIRAALAARQAKSPTPPQPLTEGDSDVRQ